ncbi:MAG: bifunctional oligoribonuclease/PAP phosphatase NrnA, partial [Saprospiraceae bacterium]|nr:bifunctional oligoribonuclease/PAP phosphatase NrnA [Saprospiraceae bacterium]
LSVAQCLMTGILTDTGSFRYNTRPPLFHKVADLLAKGVDLNELQIRLFNNMPEKQLRLLGYCLHERMEVLEEYHTAIIGLSKEDFKRFDIQRGDTEGIVNYMLMIDKIRMAVLITEQPNIIKLSFRSLGDFSVQELARDHFKGGGHKNAAGGAVYGNLAKTIEKVKALLPRYAHQLKNAQIYAQP